MSFRYFSYKYSYVGINEYSTNISTDSPQNKQVKTGDVRVWRKSLQHHLHFDCHLVFLCIPPVLCVSEIDVVISGPARDHINLSWNPAGASPFLLSQYKFGQVSM